MYRIEETVAFKIERLCIWKKKKKWLPSYKLSRVPGLALTEASMVPVWSMEQVTL